VRRLHCTNVDASKVSVQLAAGSIVLTATIETENVENVTAAVSSADSQASIVDTILSVPAIQVASDVSVTGVEVATVALPATHSTTSGQFMDDLEDSASIPVGPWFPLLACVACLHIFW